MRFVGGPGSDPGRNPRHVGGFQAAQFGLRRRHHQIGIGGGDAGEEFAPVDVTRHDRPQPTVEFCDRLLSNIQPETSFPGRGVRPMARETVLREKRADLSVVGRGSRHHAASNSGDTA